MSTISKSINPKAESPLEILSGKVQTFNSGVTKFLLFVPKMSDDPFGRAEQPLYSKTFDTNKYQPVGYPVAYPAINGVKKDICGSIVRSKCNIRDGVVLKLFIQRNGAVGIGRRTELPVTANMFIRIRKTAALRRMTIPIIQEDGVVEEAFEVIGRFDCLSLKQASLLGVEYLPQFAHMFKTDKIRQLIKFEILEPEIAVVEELKADNGAKVSIIRKKRTRKI